MNKKGKITEKTADKLTVILFFLASFISLNASPTSIASNALGIAFVISAVYGVVCIFKNKKFLF